MPWSTFGPSLGTVAGTEVRGLQVKMFVCRDIIPGCTEVITGPSDQSVLDQVIAHVAADHGLVKPPLSLVELVVATTQTMATGRSRSHLRLVATSGDGAAGPPEAAGHDRAISKPTGSGVRADTEPDGPGKQATVLSLAANRFARGLPAGVNRPTPPPVSGSPVQPHQEYRHECLFYRGTEGFLTAVVPFIQDGLTLGQPVMVAVTEPRLQAVRLALGEDADRVVFADMADLGRNPARIIPAWREFTQRTVGVPMRGVGEPIWAGRDSAELIECQLHEALLNVAVELATPLWLLCPYDVQALDDGIVTEALRSHPTVTEADNSAISRFYAGDRHAAAMFAAELPEPDPPINVMTFDEHRHSRAADRILRYARAAGMPTQRSAKLAAAADEVAQAGLGHAGGVQIRLWQHDGTVVCEVGDRGQITDPLVGRTTTDFGPQSRERGIRLANELCDLVQVRSNHFGTAVRMHSRI